MSSCARFPLAHPSSQCGHGVKLHPDCHVQFEKTYYSASFRLVRQRLWLRATETTVQLFRDHELVATHLRQFRAGSRCTIDEHLPPEAIAYKLRDPQWCLRQSEDIGAACHALIERLFAHRVLDNLRAAQSVIGLARRFGTQRLDAACQRALTFDDPKYRTVKTILENGIDPRPVRRARLRPAHRNLHRSRSLLPRYHQTAHTLIRSHPHVDHCTQPHARARTVAQATASVRDPRLARDSQP